MSDEPLISAKGRAAARDYLRTLERTEEVVLLELVVIDYIRLVHGSLEDITAEMDAVQRDLFLKAMDVARSVAS